MIGSISAPRYLALALASRTVIDELFETLQANRRSSPELGNALRSLTTVLGEKSEQQFRPMMGSAFEHYEQASTISDVIASIQEPDFGGILNEVRAKLENGNAESRDVRKLLAFFCRLEGEALHRYNEEAAVDE